MKRSEFIDKLDELFGKDDDVEIYIDVNGEQTFTSNFKITIDNDGDAIIQPYWRHNP